MFACPMSSPKMTRMFGFFSAANVDAVAIAAARVRAANDRVLFMPSPFVVIQLAFRA
jgi:hypothetical protein